MALLYPFLMTEAKIVKQEIKEIKKDNSTEINKQWNMF